MKRIFLSIAVVASLSSCYKGSSTNALPIVQTLNHEALNGDTINLVGNSDITYQTRAKDTLNTLVVNMHGAIIGSEVNILSLTSAGASFNIQVLDTSIKQAILVNGASSLIATKPTKWVINIKYFSKDYLFVTITNPEQI